MTCTILVPGPHGVPELPVQSRGPMLSTCCIVVLVLLSGCANSVMTLLKASGQTDALTPSAPVVQSKLRGRAFEVGTVGFDVSTAVDQQGPEIPDRACLELFDSQLRKAFDGAELGKGAAPAYPVDVAIERLSLKPATFLFSAPSVFRVRMEIRRTGGGILMRGQFQSILSSPTTTFIVPGVVFPVALPEKEWQYVALAKMLPAVAVVVAATAQGLQQGKTLDEIEIYPRAGAAGSMISPDVFLKNAPFGMTEMDEREIRHAIDAAGTPGGE